ncbi:MAG: hypothetical protein ACREBU_02445 [Nitrososphaera sp.]
MKINLNHHYQSERHQEGDSVWNREYRVGAEPTGLTNYLPVTGMDTDSTSKAVYAGSNPVEESSVPSKEGFSLAALYLHGMAHLKRQAGLFMNRHARQFI